MSSTGILHVQNGDEAGQRLTIPAAGARLGRSSSNDIILPDPLLSRHHCRFYFKPDDGLWVADLGSANETLVDGIAVTEAPIRKGNIIMVGETELRVEEDGRATLGAAAVDLGLGTSQTGPTPERRSIGLKPLITAAALVLVAAIAVFTIKNAGEPTTPETPPEPVPEDTSEQILTIDYEKVDANADNIFRYKLQLRPDGILAVQIDDLEGNRHVDKKTNGPVADELREEIAELIRDEGFFDLESEYRGIKPDILEKFDLSVTIGRDTHRVLVVNRMQPDPFERVRERIETFGQVELNLWATHYSTETLIDMAEAAYLNGQKLYAERQIEDKNVAEAIKSFTEAIWHLDTVSPKPDFFEDAIAMRDEAEEELDRRYKEQNFRAERAMRLGDWTSAARELEILCRMIPDRADERHRDARNKLIDVTSRLEDDDR